MKFKYIHIGNLISQRADECGVATERIYSFFKCTEEEIQEMYTSESLDTAILLKWSKLLEYDFFRIYSQNLILYAPPSINGNGLKKKNSSLPQFRKNIYTKELIDFILSQINSEAMTKNQVIEEYKIPKTTLYKWINKYEK